MACSLVLWRLLVQAAKPATTVITTTTVTGDAQQTEQLPKALLTLAVDQTEAQKIVYAQGHGKVTFGLLTEKFEINKSDAGTTAKNLFD